MRGMNRAADKAELMATATRHMVAAVAFLYAMPALRALHHALLLHVFSKRSLGPGGSVHGERANFTGLVLGCIDADFCK